MGPSAEYVKTKITDHFSMGEFASPDTGWSHPTDWDEGDFRAQRLWHLCQELEGIRTRFGGNRMEITGGWRTEQRQLELFEAGKTSTKHSLHCDGLACDFRIWLSPERQLPPLLIWYDLVANWPGGLGLYDTHIHLDARWITRGPGRARWTKLKTTDTGGGWV